MPTKTKQSAAKKSGASKPAGKVAKTVKPVAKSGKSVGKPAKVAVKEKGKSGGKTRGPALVQVKVLPPIVFKTPPSSSGDRQVSGRSASPFPRPIRPDAESESGPLTEEQLRKVKTELTRKDLDHYEELLMAKRHEILGDVASLQTDRENKNTGGNLSNMPLHMADVGSDNYEQEFTLGLVESERKLLQEIDQAVMRIRNGTFGVCMETGVPINRARLDATPWAKYCIEVAREKERMGQG